MNCIANLKDKISHAFSDQDTRNVIINMIWSFGIKGVSLVVALFTTSSYISYFHNDSILGVWFTLLSLLAWILNFDLGISNGLRNRLVKTIELKQTNESKRYISSSYIMLCSIGLVVFVLINFGVRFVDWNRILGISSSRLSSSDLLLTIRIVSGGILCQFILRLITSITYAMQQSFVANLLNLITSIWLLVFVVVSNFLHLNGDIINLAIQYILAVNVPLLMVTFILFIGPLKELKPSWNLFSWTHARQTLSLGGLFLYLQLIGMILNNSANFLISALIDSQQVVIFQLYYKVFTLISTIVAIAIVPMWSAITKARIDGNVGWLRSAFKFMYALPIITFMINVLEVAFIPWIFKIWLGSNTRPTNYGIALLFAIYGAIFTWQQVCSYISNGYGILRTQVIWATLGVIIEIVLAIILSQLFHSYIVVIIASIVALLPFCIMQTIDSRKYVVSDQL